MKKLMCAKINQNPYSLEHLTEIPERTFLIDGYSLYEILEGMPFSVKFDESGEVIDVSIDNDYFSKYFEDTFNSKKIFKDMADYAKAVINRGDEVDLTPSLKRKYFVNGINCAWIESSDKKRFGV